MTMKRLRFDNDSENVYITSKIPRFDHSFVHREEEDKDLGLGENRPIQGRGCAGTVKLGTTIVSDESVIGSCRQTTPSHQITKQVAEDVSKGSSRSSRVELLKFRFRTLIQKSQKQLLYGETDGQEMAVAISVSETRKRGESSSSSNPRKRKLEIEKLRKAAREKIESITRTVDFPNNLEVMSDMAKIMGDSSWGYGGGRKSCFNRRSTNKTKPTR